MTQAQSQALDYSQAWAIKMREIWGERIQRLKAVDTGSLLSSIHSLVNPSGQATSIELTFLRYGLYVADGVGRNFKRAKQRDGHIPFLLPGGEAYRAANRLDRPRPIGPAWRRSRNSKGSSSKREAGGRPANWNPQKRNYSGRDWYSRPLYGSRMALAEAMRRIYGEAYAGQVVKALEANFKG